MSCQWLCPGCYSSRFTKNGHTKNAKQNFICKDCRRNFVTGVKCQNPGLMVQLIKLALLERISLRGICRVFGVSMGWLLGFIVKLYAALPDHLWIILPDVTDMRGRLEIRICEADELWSFVGKKKCQKWVWLVIDRVTRQIIAFHIGGRTKRDADKLWKALPEPYRMLGLFYTDFNKAYSSAFPSSQHLSVGNWGNKPHRKVKWYVAGTYFKVSKKIAFVFQKTH